MDLNKIKKTAQIVATAGGRMMTMNTSDVFEMVELVERQEKELAGARFAAQSHQNTVDLQAAIIDGQQRASPASPGLPNDSSMPTDMTQAKRWIVQLRARVDSLLTVINAPASPASPPVALTDIVPWEQRLRLCPDQLDIHVAKDAEIADLRAALAAPVAPSEPTAPHILEALSYHERERDDLTLEDAVEAFRNGYKKVAQRDDRAMLAQIIHLLASAPVAIEQAVVPELALTGETLAWAQVAPNGNVRIWSRNRSTVDKMHAHYGDGTVVPILAAAPLPPVVARKVLSEPDIEAMALANGFKLKQQDDDTMALHRYVFDFARAIERHLMGGE